MSLEINPDRRTLRRHPVAERLVQSLEEEGPASLTGSIYIDFPIFRDADGELVTPQMLLVSPQSGVVVFALTAATRPLENEIETLDGNALSQLQHIFGRLMQSKVLPKTRTSLGLPVSCAIFAPNLANVPAPAPESDLLRTGAELSAFLLKNSVKPDLSTAYVREIEAIIQGTKGLRSPKKRDTVANLPPQSKGRQVADLEAEISVLDHKQKHGAIVSINGAQRIRGLAGSGKTVVLAMKAALAQVQFPTERILYTFHTKSLYQHIRYLITRAYRNRDYHDPDWDLLNVMHSWGGKSQPGVYSLACEESGVAPIPYSSAALRSGGDAFDYVCRRLLEDARVDPIFDFAFVDEGQDFPSSFLQLCARLTRDHRLVVAYDELQTIFQATAPSAAQMFGETDGKPNIEFEDDIVLHRCYRNPRQILVCAHALGLGIYSSKIVQMPENAAHWRDLGYEVVSGSLTAGQRVQITRPPENSPNSISNTESIDEAIKWQAFDDVTAEVRYIVDSIVSDLSDGLKPDDIMVIAADDRMAKTYLNDIGRELIVRGVRAHNIHALQGTGAFSLDDHVTLTTLHKAKGNEAFMVYVAGVDAIFTNGVPTIRQRNMVFTAMTRAKGWVRITGFGDSARAFGTELQRAMSKYPNLEFAYPTAEDFQIMKRDLEASAAQRLELERVFEGYTEEEIQAALAAHREKTARAKKKG